MTSQTKILSHNLKYIVDVVVQPNFGNFYERSYHNFNFIRIRPAKSLILRVALGSSSIIWDWH